MTPEACRESRLNEDWAESVPEWITEQFDAADVLQQFGDPVIGCDYAAAYFT